jgi:hypothetical protein
MEETREYFFRQIHHPTNSTRVQENCRNKEMTHFWPNIADDEEHTRSWGRMQLEKGMHDFCQPEFEIQATTRTKNPEKDIEQQTYAHFSRVKIKMQGDIKKSRRRCQVANICSLFTGKNQNARRSNRRKTMRLTSTEECHLQARARTQEIRLLYLKS